jgi:hypothetical protein
MNSAMNGFELDFDDQYQQQRDGCETQDQQTGRVGSEPVDGSGHGHLSHGGQGG